MSEAALQATGFEEVSIDIPRLFKIQVSHVPCVFSHEMRHTHREMHRHTRIFVHTDQAYVYIYIR